MSSTHFDTLDPAAGPFHPTGATRREARRGVVLRLVIAALGVLVLVVLGTLDPRPTTPEPAVGDAAAPAFDGRGKWGGYAG